MEFFAHIAAFDNISSDNFSVIFSFCNRIAYNISCTKNPLETVQTSRGFLLSHHVKESSGGVFLLLASKGIDRI